MEFAVYRFFSLANQHINPKYKKVLLLDIWHTLYEKLEVESLSLSTKTIMIKNNNVYFVYTHTLKLFHMKERSDKHRVEKTKIRSC